MASMRRDCHSVLACVGELSLGKCRDRIGRRTRWDGITIPVAGDEVVCTGDDVYWSFKTSRRSRQETAIRQEYTKCDRLDLCVSLNPGVGGVVGWGEEGPLI